MAKAVSNKSGKGAKTPAKTTRKGQQTARGKAAPKESGGLTKFLHDVRVEMGKVTWPSRKDLLQSTIVVLVAVAIASVYTGVLDLVFQQFVDLVLKVIT